MTVLDPGGCALPAGSQIPYLRHGYSAQRNPAMRDQVIKKSKGERQAHRGIDKTKWIR